MFVALPRKVDTILPRAAERTLPRLSSQIGAVLCPAAKGFQCVVLFQLRPSCGVPVFLSRQIGESINSRTRLPRFEAGHEQLRAAAARNRYPA
jgi:hypothetical protein